jgi:uncharacterized protein (DUF1501 family)
MFIKRRQFIQTGSLATASLMMPRFLQAFEKKNLVPPGNKVLVILQLSGGNDGLNTIIPVNNDIYYRSRPKLGIAKKDALVLNDETGLHASLPFLKSLHDDGSLGILNNVGYPNPDRSHFRSMDIWHSASNSNEYLHSGWIGRYLDAQCSGCAHPTQALEIDDVLSMAMKGEQSKALAAKDPKRLYNSANDKFFNTLATTHTDQPGEQPVDYLYKTLSETISSADYIYKQSRLHPSSASYPATEMGKSFHTIASLILSDINTKVYYLSLGSFDTHVGQDGQQKRLFMQLNNAVEAFVKDLKQNNRFNDVMLMTFSEFGRRVAQNASGGTDHGTANNMFFMSGGLQQKGLLNALPDLSTLENGDLRYKVDFKDVYATLLKKWLGANDEMILGRKADYLRFI